MPLQIVSMFSSCKQSSCKLYSFSLQIDILQANILQTQHHSLSIKPTETTILYGRLNLFPAWKCNTFMAILMDQHQFHHKPSLLKLMVKINSWWIQDQVILGAIISSLFEKTY